ncbi:MAG TPA: MBL fold metallo-hydrolase [Gemmatimonadales bacterium]|nr:MBL fold metallo-hydrolase [Gemmatimonadales bacterium]
MILPFEYGDVRYFRMARTVLRRAIYWTGVYLVDGLLVDSGPPNLARDVRRLVGELGVRQCVTTHHHEDHSGNHGLLVRELHITPLAHPSAVARLAEPDAQPQLYRRVAWGARPPASVAPLDRRIETPRFRFQVIHTPGHATDHVALFEPERGWLFSGDLYLAPRLRYLRADEDVHAMMDSLRRVLALEPQVLFCQHRGRVEQGAARLRDKLEFLVELGGRIHELHGRGWSDAAIARGLPGSDLLWRLWTAGDFSKRNFVRAFLSRR